MWPKRERLVASSRESVLSNRGRNAKGTYAVRRLLRSLRRITVTVTQLGVMLCRELEGHSVAAGEMQREAAAAKDRDQVVYEDQNHVLRFGVLGAHRGLLQEARETRVALSPP